MDKWQMELERYRQKLERETGVKLSREGVSEETKAKARILHEMQQKGELQSWLESGSTDSGK